jgi:ribosomal protein L16 Arg81 hydroxylase
MDLGELLHPVLPAAFFAEHWDIDALALRGDPRRFRELFSAADLPALLRYQRPKPPEGMLLVRGSQHYDQRWTNPDGSPRVEHVLAAWRAGYTVVINNLHELWPPVGAFAGALEGELHHTVGVNLYFSPPDTQGFLPHYDVMDVFVLQLEGNKTWEVRRPLVEAPLEDEHRNLPEGTLTELALRVDLEPGSVLYVPRGFVHSARTNATASLHLTVGVHPVTWIDLLISAARSLRKDARFRRALPPGFYSRKTELSATFGALVRDLPGQLALEDALRELAERALVAKPPPLPEFAPPRDVDGESRVKRRPTAVCHVSQTDGVAMIQYPGGRLAGPAKIALGLRYVAATKEPFAVRTLPGDLGVREKVVLVRRLLREGLLELATEE